MANIEVTLRGSHLCKSITLRALVTQACPLTKLSRQLARRLGLMSDVRGVFVKDIESGRIYCENVSTYPLTIHCEEFLRHPITLQAWPLISDSDNDYHWDLTLGDDVLSQYPDILNCSSKYNNRNGRIPSPGPGNDGDHRWLGKLFDFVPYYDIPINNSHDDTFFEFDCSRSSAVARLAYNKHVRQLIVIYEGGTGSDGSTVYRYASVSNAVQDELEYALLNKSSLGRVMQIVRDECTVGVIDEFPNDTILVDFPTIK